MSVLTTKLLAVFRYERLWECVVLIIVLREKRP